MNAITCIGTRIGGLRESVENGGDGERLFARLMREWIVLRRRDQPLLPGFVACAEYCGLNGQAAVAIDSLLSLTEAYLERPLQGGDADARAVLALLDQGRFVRGARTPRTIPHGLPGVLVWATVAVRTVFADAGVGLEAGGPVAAGCPFE